MGEVRVQFEWQVEVPHPKASLLSLSSQNETDSSCDVSASAAAAKHCCGFPLQQPEAFDWIPSVALLGDAGFELSGILVSLLDIVSVRLIPQSLKTEDADASTREQSLSDADVAVAAPVAAAPSAAAGRSSAEKENVQWHGDQSKTCFFLVVLLRSCLPLNALDPPLFPPPPDGGPETGSCLVMRARSQQLQQLQQMLPLSDAAAAAALRRSPPGLYDGADCSAAAVLLLQRLQQFICREDRKSVV